MMRRPLLRMITEAFLSGTAGALIVALLWFSATGEPPSMLTTLLGAEAVTTAWSIAQAVRFRLKWQTVLAAYNQPALGEGIDIPHRPPTDDEGTAR